MFSNYDEVPVPKNNIEEQWKSIKYENLNDLTDIVRLEQNDAFFLISHPGKTNRFAHTFGWKLHISVRPDDLPKAFDLAAPIISQYCFCFKVTNPKKIESDRLLQGTQITIPLEEQEKPVITAEQAQKMIGKINQIFLENNICPGKKPDSDAETISPYFSMRNDKGKGISFNQMLRAEYIPANLSGKNFNPLNNFNPFQCLLSSESKSFDPIQHFQSFGLEFGPDTGIKENEHITFLLYLTLRTYIHEYTLFDILDMESQEKFIIQCCFVNENNFIAQFLKHPYKENPEIQLSIKQAVRIVIAFEGSNFLNSEYHNFINSSEFSTQHPYDTSFKQLIIALETNSKKAAEHNSKQYYWSKEKTESLMPLIKRAVEKTMKDFPKETLLVLIQKGHFYSSQAAVEKLKVVCRCEEYIKILQDNDTVPAVQLELANFYYFKDSKKSEEYLLRAILSEASNCINPKVEYLKILMKYKNLEELQALDKSGNLLATRLLALIYIRDRLPSAPAEFKKFSEAPINHNLAKECFKKLETNELYVKEARELKLFLEKIESSASQTQRSCTF
jgi:hypothetical protein